MTEYARRAVPWAVVGCCAALVSVAMALVARWPYLMWPLQGVAVGVLAAAGAWCVDEPAAAVVDTTPRHLWWRTAARAAGLVPLLALWLAAVVAARAQMFGHAVDVAAQGCVALLAGCAVGTWARARGVPAPGRRIAAGAIPTAAFWALARPADERLPVFPYLETGPWSSSRVLWAAVAAGAACVLVVGLVDGAPRRRLPQTGRGRPAVPRSSAAAGPPRPPQSSPRREHRLPASVATSFLPPAGRRPAP